MNRIDNVTEYIIKKLKDNFKIHRYNSHSTNSVYLKLDWGAAHSIRISDHKGKKHLKYKYNVTPDKQQGWKKEDNCWRYYCNISTNKNIDALLDIIKGDKITFIMLNGKEAYENEVKKYKTHSTIQKFGQGFWTKAFEVN